MGPVCPYALAPVARFSGKWKIPVLSTGGQAPAFRKKSDYPLLTTMGGNYRMFGVFFAKLLRRYAWEKFAFLFHVYPEISKKGGSSCEFSLNDIWSVYKEGKKTYEQPFYEPLHEDRLNSTEIKALLERVKDKARGKNFLFFEKKSYETSHDIGSFFILNSPYIYTFHRFLYSDGCGYFCRKFPQHCHC